MTSLTLIKSRLHMSDIKKRECLSHFVASLEKRNIGVTTHCLSETAEVVFVAGALLEKLRASRRLKGCGSFARVSLAEPEMWTHVTY